MKKTVVITSFALSLLGLVVGLTTVAMADEGEQVPLPVWYVNTQCNGAQGCNSASGCLYDNTYTSRTYFPTRICGTHWPEPGGPYCVQYYKKFICYSFYTSAEPNCQGDTLGGGVVHKEWACSGTV
jgi:hypothetical protein